VGEGIPSVGDVIVEVFCAVGIAVSYAWDTIKAGHGVIALVAGVIVEGFGLVVKAFKEVVSLAKELPESLRPAGLDNFIAGDKVDASISAAVGKMKDWGKNAVVGFGNSAKKFSAWLDNALKKKNKLAEAVPLNDTMSSLTASTPKFAAALAPATKEAYSLILKNQFGMNGGKDVAKEQLKEVKKANKLNEKKLQEQKKLNDLMGKIGAT
jgi:hypothetical protein